VIDQLCDLNARVVYFPVRHHSPACAGRVRDLIRQLRPGAVLIEGPADFNDRIDELFLPHQLPIAIYSYARLTLGRRLGAYYPFCVYSPEWQALLAARAVGAAVQFIDLPWFDIGRVDGATNRYADHELTRGEYVRRLCRETGVENFDDFWDAYFEVDEGLPLEVFLRRFHHFCLHSRLLDGEVRLSDRRREAFMAGRVRHALAEFSGGILVVTGGYHSAAIHARLTGQALAGADDPVEYEPEPIEADAERGIALTPYSYDRLDSLRGYEAGLPNPGFYHQIWHDRQKEKTDSHRSLLARVARNLRHRGQRISTADLIAAETTARGLALIRGHAQVWRRDLVDGLVGAILKEERAYGMGHPLLDAIHEVFRGGERGSLAEGAELPPLVRELRRLLAAHDLIGETKEREIELDLYADADRERSRLLHQLRILAVAGYDRIDGTDLAARDDLSRVWEKWRIRWSPDFEATRIEAARYGPTPAEAVAARLTERSAAVERDAEQAALLLLDAALAGLSGLAATFWEQFARLIRGDADFISVTKGLGHLLYLFVYDRVLQTSGRTELASLLEETFTRGLWLLESLGQVAGRERELLAGVRLLLDALERGGKPLAVHRDEFAAVCHRVADDRNQLAVVRGAATGALWTLGAADAGLVRRQLLRFTDPDRLGDFLTGLFCLARETVQRHHELVKSIDELLVAYADEEFLTALPALRLAFTYFTPREKHYLASTLLESLGLRSAESLAVLPVTAETAARAVAFESRLFAAARRFGVRGGTA
jgi:hypothetical protein